ncbi:Oxysterol-binding protein-domain-containing protein [Leucosporidium creatinivorum]|uniref:Oxysterol-binding protein-domain-containing protein n=1 Tax=Leucosporidium creatinivorum TaxID=106004 RepID=A0A1Y2FY22_9BASI|nr:Oxysterol-binding protein-domain-containing protein [Leucosporidium creatinivorum]
MSEVPRVLKAPEAIMQGYLLKKKRKKMQGLARRYFWLSPSGALSYSFNPTSPIRDSLLVNLAYVSANRKSKMLHIDSGKTVYHCKALTLEEFDRWTEALKQFSGTVQEREFKEEESNRPESFYSAHEGGSGGGGAAPVDIAAVNAIVMQMSGPLQDLETMHLELKQQGDHTPSPLHSPGNKLKFFKKHGGQPKDSLGRSPDDYFEAKPMNGDLLIKQHGAALFALKQQHEALTAALRAFSHPPFVPPPLPHSNSFDPSKPLVTYASRSSAGFHRSTPSRASSFSLASGENEDFYDALPGEFVLEEEDKSSDEEDVEEEEGPGESGFVNVVADQSFSSDESEVEVKEEAPVEVGAVHRRSKLPSPITGDEFSMLGMLRKNVGKDLSTISFPVTMNEPLSGLQRIAEELEYSELLDRAASTDDPIERLTWVATFAISGASGNKYRSSRKPFNPLLGETYECIRPDKGFKFVAEKVSHTPVVMAFHSEGKQGWEMNGYIAPTQKFWGRSMEVFVTGDFNISFPATGDVYSIRKPSSFVRNLVAGTKYLELVGDLVITNESTGHKAVIAFKEGSAWGGSSTRNKIDGKVYDERGNVRVELAGRWDEHVDKKEGGSHFTRLWQINDPQPNPERYYGFSRFTTELNELTPIEDGLLAPTDSRLRPDQLAMERGDIDEAEATKKRVEEKQRSKRKALQDAGQELLPPVWFVKDGEGWRYGGEYFDTRDKKAFADPDIY